MYISHSSACKCHLGAQGQVHVSIPVYIVLKLVLSPSIFVCRLPSSGHQIDVVGE